MQNYSKEGKLGVIPFVPIEVTFKLQALKIKVESSISRFQANAA
jgi:hypothetical protein